MSHPALLVSAAHKSSGKTTVTLALAAALAARGHAVQPFKKGPDYIDPMWLTLAAGRPCINLDPQLMGWDEITQVFAQRMRGAGIGLVEGNKGLHDGLALDGSNSNAALAAQLARWSPRGRVAPSLCTTTFQSPRDAVANQQVATGFQRAPQAHAIAAARRSPPPRMAPQPRPRYYLCHRHHGLVTLPCRHLDYLHARPPRRHRLQCEPASIPWTRVHDCPLHRWKTLQTLPTAAQLVSADHAPGHTHAY